MKHIITYHESFHRSLSIDVKGRSHLVNIQYVQTLSHAVPLCIAFFLVMFTTVREVVVGWIDCCSPSQQPGLPMYTGRYQCMMQ